MNSNFHAQRSKNLKYSPINAKNIQSAFTAIWTTRNSQKVRSVNYPVYITTHAKN